MNFKEGDFVKLTYKIDRCFAILKILEVKEDNKYKYKVIKRLHPERRYKDWYERSIPRVRIGKIDNTKQYKIEVITEDEVKVDIL